LEKIQKAPRQDGQFGDPVPFEAAGVIWNGRDAVLENLLCLLNSLIVCHRRDDH
jgi:hypothetical protein